MNKPIIIILAVLTIVFAVLTVYFTLKKKMALRVLIKTSASLSFLTLGIISLFYAVVTDWFIMILIGLAFGLLGDIFLALPSIAEEKYKEILDLFGLIFFLIGHLFYIAAFLLIADGFNFWLLFILPVLPAAVCVLEKKKIFNAKRAFIPAIIYSVVLCLMLISAINLVAAGGIFNTVIFIAALFFISSDTLLAFYNFSKFKYPTIMYTYMPLYYIAQIVFAVSLLI